jgi:hypothetical protein
MDDIDFRRFHNAIRLLFSIDAPELWHIGLSPEEARAFIADPPRGFIHLDTDRAVAVWEIIEGRRRQG